MPEYPNEPQDHLDGYFFVLVRFFRRQMREAEETPEDIEYVIDILREAMRHHQHDFFAGEDCADFQRFHRNVLKYLVDKQYWSRRGSASNNRLASYIVDAFENSVKPGFALRKPTLWSRIHRLHTRGRHIHDANPH
jgi:hypothetical protein